MHIGVANLHFPKRDLSGHHRVAEVASWVDMVSVLVPDVSVGPVMAHLGLCASSVPADSVLCHFDKESSHPFDFHEP